LKYLTEEEKMTKKLWVISFIVLLVVAALAACAPAPVQTEQAAWSVKIEGANKDAFTSDDYAKLDQITIETVLKTKDGTATDETWQGVHLNDVLDELGVKEYASITLEASDGYAKDYTPDIVNDDQTILGTVVNGETLTQEDGFVYAVPASQPGNMRVKMLAKITVHE
jgi:hypothetical protein